MVYFTVTKYKGGFVMKKFVIILMVLSLSAGSALFAGVTEKVEKLMDTNQSRERTYYPRDMKPNLVKAHFGYPYMAGATYSYNIDQMFAVGIGAGAYFPGVSAGINFTMYPLPNIVSPYIGAGISYLGTAFQSSVFAANAEAGIDFALDNGFCINLGIVYLISFAESEETFGTAWGDTKTEFNDLGIQMGAGVRF